MDMKYNGHCQHGNIADGTCEECHESSTKEDKPMKYKKQIDDVINLLQGCYKANDSRPMFLKSAKIVLDWIIEDVEHEQARN